MVVSLRLHRRGRRIDPSPPASTYVAGDSRPHAAASLDVLPPPLPPCEAAVSLLHTGIVARSELPDRNETLPVELDLEPSFALNLFLEGYSVGEIGKGMLLYLIGDDPKKRPYSRASRALLSDIEHGCLPQDILHGIPCKFQNGSTVCEVRDYRSVFSNGDDYSGDDFPRVNRVHLRLGTECVVKDLSSIADASWTYHDQLTAESVILSAMQPRLNLDPTPSLEMLCNSRAKKIDLGLNTEGKHGKHTSVLMMPTNPPENCKTREFSICKSATLCVENAALEGKPSGLLNSLSINCPSTIHVHNAKSAAKSGTDNTRQCSSSLPNTSVLCDKMTCDYLFHSKTGQPVRVKVLPQKTKKLSYLQCENHEFKKCSTPNKNGMSTSQNSKGPHKSTSSPNKTELDIGSRKRLQVEAKVGQKICNKDMEVHVPFSVPPRDPCTSLNTTNQGIERIPEKVAPFVVQNYSGMVDANDRGTPFVASFSGCSRKAACEPLEYMSATKSQGTASKRKASEICIISLNQECKLNGKRQQNVDTQMNTPCKNRSFEEPAVTAGIDSQLDIDLELDKGRQQIEDPFIVHISAYAPESCNPRKLNVCKAVAVCSENAAVEGMQSAMFKSSPLNYPSSVHVNDAKSIVESDPGSTIQSISTLTNSSALCDRKQDGSITPVPDHFLKSYEEQPQVTVSQFDRENRQTQKVTVVPQKRKKSLKLLNERHGSKNHSRPNKSARLSYQNSKGQKSTGSSNKEGFHLGSPKVPQVEVKVGKIIGNKDLKVQEKVPLSVDSSCHPHMSTSNRYVKNILENVKSFDIWSNEHHEDPVADLKISDMADPKGSRIPSVTLCSANSTEAPCGCCEDKAATEPQLKALNRKATEISSISVNQEINLNGERQQKFDIHIECENRSMVEPAITVGVNSKPDIEKILSEVILTTERHGLNKTAAKSDVVETSWLLPPYEFFQFENVDEIPPMRDETMTYNVTNGATSTWKIRRLTFHPSQYSSCLVDKSLYKLFLLESESLDNQITVGTIYGDEQMHITTLPTSSHAEKFVDQFISLMKRDGYNLCNDEMCNESSELIQQSEDVSHLGHFPTGEDAEYLLFSPSVNTLPIITNNKIGCTIENKLPDFHAPLKPLTQQLLLTEQPLTLESPEAFFFNPSHLPGGQQYTGQHLQDQSSSFACNPFATDPLQFPSAQPSQEVSVDQYMQFRDDILGFSDIYSASRYNQLHQEALMDQYLQYRHDLPGFIHTYGMRTAARRNSQWRQEVPMGQYLQYRHDVPWFSDAYGASMTTRSCGQWRQVYTQMGSVVYQWDLPAFGRQIHNSPPLLNGWSIPLSELQPIRSPQMSSDQEPTDELEEHGLCGSHKHSSSDPKASRLPIPVARIVMCDGRSVASFLDSCM